MNSKLFFLGSMVALLLIFTGCKKDKKPDPISPTASVKYSSIDDFYSKNGVQLQTYKINATTGGSFTSPKGTIVRIPGNCFVNSSNVAASGEVTIQFKDIYTKSDMLLSDMPTTFFNGTPLKSGGEFFINALAGAEPLEIASGQHIEIEQPAENMKPDTAMEAMVLNNDSIQGGGGGWFISPGDELLFNTTNYIFNLYSFGSTPGAGIWCNSDNPYYFQAFSQTTLTINEVAGYNMDVFLVFKNVNSMVHVYKQYNTTTFPYQYAPLGQECTVVVVGVKDEKLYASFTPVTITSNLSVNPMLEEITTEAFKAQLSALN